MNIFKIFVFLFLFTSSLLADSEFDTLFNSYNFKLGDKESDFLKNNFNITTSQTLIVQKEILVLPTEMKMYSIQIGKTKNLKQSFFLDKIITDIVVYFYKNELVIISTIYQNFTSIDQITSIMNKNFGKPNYSKSFFFANRESNLVYKWEKTATTALLDYTQGFNKATFFVFDNKTQEEIKEKLNPPKIKIVEKLKTVTKEKKLTEDQCKRYYNLTNKYDQRIQKYNSRIKRYNKKRKRFERAVKKTKSQEKRKAYSAKVKRYNKRIKRYNKRIKKYDKRIKRYKKLLLSCKITKT